MGSWGSGSYEGECDDCGCLFDRKGGFDVPTWNTKKKGVRFRRRLYG